MQVNPAAVEASGWGWRHATRKDFALRAVDFTIRPGERVLLLGASGAGKSTMMAGLAGVLGGDEEGEQEGSLTIDGVDAREARGRVGLVLQDPDSQTILERAGDDTAFGCENLNLPKDEIWNRARAALDIVGLDYMAFDRSTRGLSGGQRQRLTIARALVEYPQILVMDDSASALDVKTDAALRRAVRELAGRAPVFSRGIPMTTVIVSQRVSTVRDADMICVLNHGSVAGLGAHDELYATCQLYREICQSQLRREELEGQQGNATPVSAPIASASVCAKEGC